MKREKEIEREREKNRVRTAKVHEGKGGEEKVQRGGRE